LTPELEKNCKVLESRYADCSQGKVKPCQVEISYMMPMAPTPTLPQMVCVLADGSGKDEVRAMRRLLRELDVADDGTTSKAMQTRAQFREAYGLEPGPLQLTS